MDLNQILKTTKLILCHHGGFNQIPKAIEEYCELITELGNNYGHNSSKERLQDEIADAIIMSLQMAHLFGFEGMRDRIEFKLNRELKRIHLAKVDYHDKALAESLDKWSDLEDNIHYGE